MHAPASRRSNAAQNNGVQADSFSGCVGLRKKVRVAVVAVVGGSGCGYGRTKMCSGRIRSFCTAEGAMKALSLQAGNQDQCDTQANEIENFDTTLAESKCLLPSPLPNLNDKNIYTVRV
jgi:hypothetical protein